MMHKNSYLVTVLLLMLSISNYGQAQTTVSTAQAQKVAQTFALGRSSTRAVGSTPTLKLVYTATKSGRLKAGVNDTTAADVYYHVFNVGNNNGFVIVAGNDVAKPILGYADHGSFGNNYDSLPPALKDLLSQYQTQIQWAIDYKLKPDSSTRKRWINYRNGVLPLAASSAGASSSGVSRPSAQAVDAGVPTTYTGDTLLTLWDQWLPYNQSFPTFSSLGLDGSSLSSVYGGRAYTGCVVTAISQILYYWYQKGYTVQVTKDIPVSDSVEINGVNTLNNFGGSPVFPDIPAGTAFDWGNMRLSYPNGESGSVNDSAVAKLMQAVGAAISNEVVYDYSDLYSYSKNQLVWTVTTTPAAYWYIDFESSGTSAVPSDFWNGGLLPQLPNKYASYFGFQASDVGYPGAQYIDLNIPDVPSYESWLMGYIRQGYPLFYAIFGTYDNGADQLNHAIVCDAYDSTGGDTTFHFNFGWGGSTDQSDDYGWYQLYALNFDYGGSNANIPLTGNNSQYAFAIYPVGAPAALPVRLISFTAQAQTNNTALLQWSTATEINNKGFAVQRSTDGAQNWSTIGFVNSEAVNGNSSVQLNYSYTDAQPLNGINYYRLAQTDLNGSVTYSSVQSVQFSGLKEVSVYPNPVQSQLSVIVPSNAVYTLISESGTTVLQGALQAGKNSISVSGIANGIYFLRITSNGVTSTHKVVVMK